MGVTNQMMDDNGVPITSKPVFSIGVTQSIAIGAASAQSAALSAGVKFVRVTATSACFLTWGSNPTATNQGFMLSPNESEILAIPGGSKIAVIQDTTGGRLGIAELGVL